jgi:hypothetical protein
MATLDERENTVAVVWPTIGALGCGRLVGRLAGWHPPGDRLHLVGRILAVACIPWSLCVFFWQVLPFIARRYRITTRRVIVQKGLGAADERSLNLDQFDEVAVEILPGQEWLHTGDVVFRRAGQEVFRLAGVPSPQPFQAMCRDVQRALAIA